MTKKCNESANTLLTAAAVPSGFSLPTAQALLGNGCASLDGFAVGFVNITENKIHKHMLKIWFGKIWSFTGFTFRGSKKNCAIKQNFFGIS